MNDIDKIQSGDLEFFENQLKKRGPEKFITYINTPVSFEDNSFSLLLIKAVQYHQFLIFRFLLNAGANIYGKDSSGHDAEFYCKLPDDLAILECIEQHQIINPKPSTAFIKSVTEADFTKAKHYLNMITQQDPLVAIEQFCRVLLTFCFQRKLDQISISEDDKFLSFIKDNTEVDWVFVAHQLTKQFWVSEAKNFGIGFFANLFIHKNYDLIKFFLERNDSIQDSIQFSFHSNRFNLLQALILLSSSKDDAQFIIELIQSDLLSIDFQDKEYLHSFKDLTKNPVTIEPEIWARLSGKVSSPHEILPDAFFKNLTMMDSAIKFTFFLNITDELDPLRFAFLDNAPIEILAEITSKILIQNSESRFLREVSNSVKGFEYIHPESVSALRKIPRGTGLKLYFTFKEATDSSHEAEYQQEASLPSNLVFILNKKLNEIDDTEKRNLLNKMIVMNGDFFIKSQHRDLAMVSYLAGQLIYLKIDTYSLEDHHLMLRSFAGLIHISSNESSSASSAEGSRAKTFIRNAEKLLEASNPSHIDALQLSSDYLYINHKFRELSSVSTPGSKRNHPSFRIIYTPLDLSAIAKPISSKTTPSTQMISNTLEEPSIEDSPLETSMTKHKFFIHSPDEVPLKNPHSNFCESQSNHNPDGSKTIILKSR